MLLTALGEKEIMTVYSGWQSTRMMELGVLGFSAFSFLVVLWQIKASFEMMLISEDIYNGSGKRSI